MESQLDMTSALRAGLGSNRLSVGSAGLSLGIPGGVNPFDYFADLPAGIAASDSPASDVHVHRQDIAEMQVAADRGEDAHVAPGSPSASIDDLMVARMVQTMAAFGRSQGEADRLSRDGNTQRFDYFA
jgi:hypothetical protein